RIMKIAVIGSGSWGTALAKVLSENKHDTVLWGRKQAIIDEINQTHTNEKYLPNVSLPKEIKATTSLSEAVSKAAMIILVVPTNAMSHIEQDLKTLLKERTQTLI